jgi:hypothetical protein
MDQYVSEVAKKHQDAVRAGDYVEASRLEEQMRQELSDRLASKGEEIAVARVPEDVKLQRGHLTKSYNESIRLYRDACALVSQTRVLKKMIRDQMVAQRRPRKKKEGDGVVDDVAV